MMSKTAIIFGGTGLVGAELLSLLIESEEYSNVKAFVRRPLSIHHDKLEQVIIDFDSPASYESKLFGDHIYLCLGTTMAKAGSKDAFYKIDYTYSFKVASVASVNKVKKLCLISALGADVNSNIYYSEVKGRLEEEVKKMAFEAIHIVRPSLLLGERKEKRLGERIGIVLSKALSFLFVGPLNKYKGISATAVAKAMLHFMNDASRGVQIHESIKLQKFN